jgi:hypothetical protein
MARTLCVIIAPVAQTLSRFRTFAEFYPYYLSEHANRTCRRLHFAGTTLALAFLLHAFSTLNFWWLLAALACGYAFAWVGHFFFEKNRPATFTYPFYSLLGDWVMWKDLLTGRLRF